MGVDNPQSFVPNPTKHDSQIARRMYIFVGKLLGVSIRIRADLPFCFDRFVWRHLLSEDHDNDLEESMEEKRLNDLIRLDPDYVDEIKTFESCSKTFCAKRYNEEEFELFSGGKYVSFFFFFDFWK